MAQRGTDTLRTNLHDAPIALAGLDHFEAFGWGVRHWLLAIHIFAGVTAIDDDLFVPEIRDGGEDAINTFAVKEVAVVAGRKEVGIAGDLFGQEVVAVIQIGRHLRVLCRAARWRF